MAGRRSERGTTTAAGKVRRYVGVVARSKSSQNPPISPKRDSRELVRKRNPVQRLRVEQRQAGATHQVLVVIRERNDAGSALAANDSGSVRLSRAGQSKNGATRRERQDGVPSQMVQRRGRAVGCNGAVVHPLRASEPCATMQWTGGALRGERIWDAPFQMRARNQRSTISTAFSLWTVIA